MAVWLCVLIGCFLSILTVAAEALPSDSGFTSMRTVVLSKSSSVQEDRHDTTSFSVYYRSAVSKIERGFRNNAATLKAATEGLRSIVYNGNLRIYKVYIIGAASPEGRPELNARLARDRAEGVKAFLKSVEPRLTDADFVVISRGEDWEGATKIAASYDTETGSSTVSDIFKDSQNSEAKKLMMKRLQGGNVWRRLISDYYPSLRRTDIHVLYSTVRPIGPVECELPEVTLEVPYSVNIAPPTVLPEVEFPEPEPPKERFYTVAVKTNLLYDAVTALNAEVEFPVGKNFSVMVEDVFPWWSWGPNGKKYCFQIWSMGIEPRWWFARDDRKGLSYRAFRRRLRHVREIRPPVGHEALLPRRVLVCWIDLWLRLAGQQVDEHGVLGLRRLPSHGLPPLPAGSGLRAPVPGQVQRWNRLLVRPDETQGLIGDTDREGFTQSKQKLIRNK